MLSLPGFWVQSLIDKLKSLKPHGMAKIFLKSWSNCPRRQSDKMYQRFLTCLLEFPGGPVVKSLPASAGDKRLIPVLGRFHTPQGN